MTKPQTSRSKRAELESNFLTGLSSLRQDLRRAFDQELRSFGLSRALARPLVLIAEHEGIRSCELAGQLDIEGPSLVRLLDQLAAEGLIVRRTHASDQRARTLHLTPAGADVASRVLPIVERVRRDLLVSSSSADIETCLRVFAQLSETCKREVLNAPV